MTKAAAFLQSHELAASCIDMDEVVDLFLSEMEAGLAGEESSLEMIPSYIEAENKMVEHQPVIAIDAGGTNFRVATASFDGEQGISVEKLHEDRMPATKTELSKDEFFAELTDLLQEHRDDSNKIGFCFSYPVEIYPNRDGRLIRWSKEVQAPEVVDQMIGENLRKAMESEKEIVILNDTVATLLAGKARSADVQFDTYIGFILGTGTNTCYIESNANITKAAGLDENRSQIINIESGNFNKMPRAKVDIDIDNATATPGQYTFEKMISGQYIGSVCDRALKLAADDHCFSEQTNAAIQARENLLPDDANRTVLISEFVSGGGDLDGMFSDPDDRAVAVEIVEGLIERAAKLVAANLAAVILKTGKAHNADRPALLVIEGTTFYKLGNMRECVESYLSEYLSGEKQRYYRIADVDNASLKGAAIAALVN